MAVKPIPEGYHTVCPYLLSEKASDLLDFLIKGLGAKPGHVMRDDQGAVRHAEVQIGDSHVMLGSHTSMPCMLHLYVDDADAWFTRAIAAEATSVREVRNEFYGDRSGGVQDPFGNQWWFATHVEDVSEEEMKRRSEEFMKKRS